MKVPVYDESTGMWVGFLDIPPSLLDRPFTDFVTHESFNIIPKELENIYTPARLSRVALRVKRISLKDDIICKFLIVNLKTFRPSQQIDFLDYVTKETNLK